MISDVVDDEVVTLVAPREVFARVVDHARRAERSHQFDIACAADTRDLGAHRLRDLYGIGEPL